MFSAYMTIIQQAALTILSNNNYLKFCLLYGSGVPTDGTTGHDIAAIGATYVDTAAGEHYINKGTLASPVWKKVTTAA